MRYCPFCGREITSSRARICDSLYCRQRLNRLGMQTTLKIPDGYLTTAGYARLQGMATQTVNKHCRAGRIKGAIQDAQSGRWFIPASVEAGAGASVIERRAVRHKLKVTQAEYDEIVARADRLGLSVNDYLIVAALKNDKA